MEKLIDYVMCVRVFGEIPSPGCCNYALQRTDFNNVSSYSKEATNTLLRNSYVHNVLKSVPSVRDVGYLLDSGQVALMTDIEVMFHHMHTPEKERSFLSTCSWRILIWKNLLIM